MIIEIKLSFNAFIIKNLIFYKGYAKEYKSYQKKKK